MAVRLLLRRWQPNTAAPCSGVTLNKAIYVRQCCYSAAATNSENIEKEKNIQWLILPPFTPTADGCSIGKKLYGRPEETSTTTALKWILKCCPQLPRSLVQKLFRLRQVRKECSSAETNEQRPRRVGAKDVMGICDRIFLPKSVDERSHPTTTDNQSFSSEEDRKFVQSLELYKDSAIIVINKPLGMPAQGGVGIKRSLDELAAKYLRYDHMEPPRLVPSAWLLGI